MTKSIKNTSINQAKSDAKRGVKVKGFKLPLDTIDEIKALATKQGITETALLLDMIKVYKEQLDSPD